MVPQVVPELSLTSELAVSRIARFFIGHGKMLELLVANFQTVGVLRDCAVLGRKCETGKDTAWETMGEHASGRVGATRIPYVPENIDGRSPSGKAPDFGSGIEGSNPSRPV